MATIHKTSQPEVSLMLTADRSQDPSAIRAQELRREVSGSVEFGQKKLPWISCLAFLCLCALFLPNCIAEPGKAYVLFDGKSLIGWKSNEETPDVFSITAEGELKVDGGRAHLFWMGTDAIPAKFKDFELQMQVKTSPQGNSGIFFHTVYQESGWPDNGYEAQINSTHKDIRKTGSVYAIQDVEHDAPSTDGEWFDYSIRVQGKTITILVNGTVVNKYTEPENPERKRPGVRLSQGTFAIQGHDPDSITYYKNIRLSLLD